jgi:hypothetical protein
VTGSYNYIKEYLGSIKLLGIFEWLRNYWALQKDSAPRSQLVTSFLHIHVIMPFYLPIFQGTL